MSHDSQAIDGGTSKGEHTAILAILILTWSQKAGKKPVRKCEKDWKIVDKSVIGSECITSLVEKNIKDVFGLPTILLYFPSYHG